MARGEEERTKPALRAIDYGDNMYLYVRVRTYIDDRRRNKSRRQQPIPANREAAATYVVLPVY